MKENQETQKENNNETKQKIIELDIPNNILKPINSKKNCTPFIELLCNKWKHSSKKNLFSFFDYSSLNLHTYKFYIDSTGGTIIDNYTSVKFLKSQIKFTNPKFLILSSNNKKSSPLDYLNENIIILPNKYINKNKEYKIKVNQYTYFPIYYLPENHPLIEINTHTQIKIGKYNISILIIKKKSKFIFSNEENIIKTIFITPQNENEIVCRICLHKCTNDELYINLCKCKGSIKYAHLNCLKEWILNKYNFHVKKINEHIYKIEVSNMDNCKCELCRDYYPLFIDINNVYYSLIDLLLKENKYMLIKINLDNDDDNEYYILCFDDLKNIINIGRSRINDLILSNDSVSRKHCSIEYDEMSEKIKIKDFGSRFGTLVQDNLSKYDEELILDCNNDNIILQKGNLLYKFQYKYYES